MDKQQLYRSIPKVDRLMDGAVCRQLIDAHGEPLVLNCVREVLEDLREAVDAMDESRLSAVVTDGDLDAGKVEALIEERVTASVRPGLTRVINATGTILHTNLGRAPISREAAGAALDLITGYTNIEYDPATGERGERGGRCEELLRRLTGAEDALIVNNNAACVLLILHALCQGREVVVSRGELVEIGGHFRIPDVMEASGSILREVGTTNKTRLQDYAAAINDQTAALMKVHTSNYRIVGFTDEVQTEELAALAHERGIPMFEDLGSGALIDLAGWGIGEEPTVQACVQGSADLICFSADKLLGGPQAGVILGSRAYVAQLRHHPMMRALRTDKFTAAVLERTLLAYLDGERVTDTVPVLRMATAKPEELKEKAGRLAKLIQQETYLSVSVEPVTDRIGGGALPLEELAGYAARVHGPAPVGEEIRLQLLEGEIPVAARIADGDLIFSARTIDEADFEIIAAKVRELRW